MENSLEKNKNYLYIVSFVCSVFTVLIGLSILSLAIPWMVLQSTNSIILIGTIATIALCVIFLGSLLSNKIITKLGTRKTIIYGFISNFIAILGIIYCFLKDELNIPLLIFFIVLNRLLDSPSNIAYDSRLPELAKYSKVPLAKLNAIKEGFYSSSFIIGPALAGWMFSVVDPIYILVTAFIFNIIAFLFFFPIYGFYRNKKISEETITVLTTVKWILKQPRLKAFMIFLIIIMSSYASFDEVLLPTFINETTKNPLHIGWVFASWGVSAIISALIYAKYSERIKDIIWIRLALFGALVMFIGLYLFENIYLIVLITFLTGVLSGSMFVLVDTKFMLETPKSMRISMLTSLHILMMGLAPITVFIHTLIIENFSIKTLCLIIIVIVLLSFFLKIKDKKF